MATTVDSEQVKAAVRETYGRIATEERSAGCCGSTGCCGPGAEPTSDALGYSDEERRGAPEGADLGLGCGNPQAVAELKSGERVLDLGSGAGFDAFLAARQVGETGRVIGVDMTAEMIAKARANVVKNDLRNVEFRLGEIEHLPVPDASVDVIMSNCVINLSTDKPAVFREAFRVLAPGGRLAISDIVAIREIPDAVRNDLEVNGGCVSGAALVGDVEGLLVAAGLATMTTSSSSEVPTRRARPLYFSRGRVGVFMCSSVPTASLRACRDTWFAGSKRRRRSRSGRGRRSLRSKETDTWNGYSGVAALVQ
jgi:arsenite methyltransferase